MANDERLIFNDEWRIIDDERIIKTAFHMNLEVKKYRLIELIVSIDDEQLIDEIYNKIKQLVETSAVEAPQNKKD